MNQKELFDELEAADTEIADAILPKPDMKIIPLSQVPNTQAKGKPKFQWKNEDQSTQIESPVIEEHRQEIEKINRETAHKLLDSMGVGTLDDSLALQRWIKALSPEALQQETQAFLSRHEVNDKLFFINGYFMLETYGEVNFREIRDRIFAMRPNGMNTYCHVCDTCHYTDPCERYTLAHTPA